MASILFCKNKPVYNIDSQEVYDINLLPGYMKKYPCSNTFKNWFKLRYSSNTNTIARQLKGVIFGQGNRVSINKTTHALSLSDCYWVKDDNEDINFEHISPYFSDFWKGEGAYLGLAIPTLYVGGYLNKEWINSQILCKYGSATLIEYDCYLICKACNIAVAKIDLLNNNSIAVHNITNIDYMLEQADESGIINPDDFDETTIVKYFDLAGLQMLVIDAICGNGDRHAGNFGWLRDTNTGEYVSMCPLYDFDHALDETNTTNLISSILSVIKQNPKYYDETIRILKIILNMQTNITFKGRAQKFLNMLK